MEQGHIFIEGVINEKTYDKVKKEIDLNSTAKELLVHIGSPGGSVYDGYRIYHALVNSGKKINARIEGEAQSMATFITIAAYATGGIIEMNDPGTYMIHNPSQGLEGDAETLEGGASELRKIEDEMANAYSKKTGIDIEEIKQMMKKETRLGAVEAKKLGFVDHVTSKLRAVAFGHNYEIETMKQIEELKQ